MIWSSCFDPVPPILKVLSGAALIASTYSLTLLYGLSALTHRTNSSSAIIETGVRSFQLNGMPVASGVVNRFDSVIISLWPSPLAFFAARKPSPPAPPDWLITTTDCLDRLCFVIMPCITRAIWSAPPPVPAGTMISIGWVGSHACAGIDIATAPPKQSAATPKVLLVFRISLLPSVFCAAGLYAGSAFNSSPLWASYPVQIKSQIADSPIRACNRLRRLRAEADLRGVFAAQHVSRALT